MSSRRASCVAAGGAAVRARRIRRVWPSGAEARPLGGRRVSIVDVHAHCLFPEVAQRVPDVNVPRAAPPSLVLGPERIAAMDERGIDVQALSVNTYWWYSASRDGCAHRRGHARRRYRRVVQAAPDAVRGLQLGRAAISGPRGRAARARRQESRRARRLDRRPCRQRAADGREVRSVLGQGRGARRARVHASEQRAEHRARGRARRPRGPRQHRRQSARDDGVLEPHDLRRHARSLPASHGLRAAHGGGY